MMFRAFIVSFVSLAALATAPRGVAQAPDYSALDTPALTRLAQSGDAEAAFTLAFNAFDELDGTEPTQADMQAVLALMERADALGSAEAANTLSVMYSGQLAPHIPADLAKAEAALQRGVDRGSEAAAMNLAMRELSAPDIATQDAGIARLEGLMESETVGGVAAETLLDIYMRGHGSFDVQIDKVEGAARRCADNPDSEGHCAFIVARTLQNGWGRTPDPEGATAWFERAARAGDARAQWHYGMAILQGVGVEIDNREAFTWVKASAEQDYLNGLISLAVMYAQGDGTPLDQTAAFTAYDRAAKLGSAHALRGLSGMIYAGEGRAANPDLGIAGLMVAADRGDILAPRLLEMLLQETGESLATKRKNLAGLITSVERDYPVPPKR